MLSFGLVSVPVQLYSATEAHGPTFHQFEEGTADRIRYERVNQRTGDKVEYSDVVKGADIGGGNYVMLDQDELDSIAPGRSRSLDIHTFADLDEIDPLYFNKTYFLGPGSEEATKPYTLLCDAMGDSGKAAIASFVMRSKEYLAAVRADGDLLVLETLFFADEVRDSHAEIGNLPGRVKLSQQERRMARQLVDAMSGPWDPSGLPRHIHRYGQRPDRCEETREGVPASRRAADCDQRGQPGGGIAGERRCRQEIAGQEARCQEHSQKGGRGLEDGQEDRWEENSGQEDSRQAAEPEGSGIAQVKPRPGPVTPWLIAFPGAIAA